MKKVNFAAFTDTCVGCGVRLTATRQRRRGKFCSYNCKLQHDRKVYRETHPLKEDRICGSTLGAIHELVAAAALMRRGYAVFRAFSPACPCDLIAMKQNQLIRVEVTTGTRGGGREPDRVQFAAHNPDNYDLLAIVMADNEIEFRPPFTETAVPDALSFGAASDALSLAVLRAQQRCEP